MNNQKFLEKYLSTYYDVLSRSDIEKQAIKTKELFVKVKKKKGKIIFAGNGASAAIASHAALDFTKQARIRGVCFNDAALLTAFSNDYGYKYSVEKALEFYADKEDVVVLISSSGRSPNVVNAAKYAKKKKLKIITFTGFSKTNPLKSLGDINFWINSRSYNMVESIHMFWLMTVCDLIIGKSEYSVS